MFNFVHQSLTVNGIQKKIYGKVVNKVINVKFASKSVQCNSKQTKKKQTCGLIWEKNYSFLLSTNYQTKFGQQYIK